VGSERLEKAFFIPETPLPAKSFWYSWIDTVIDYSHRKVSFEEDRLVALAGVASEFQRLGEGNVYLAELWSRDLLEG